MKFSRRQLLLTAAAASLTPELLAAESKPAIKLGLVTYNWGKAWDLPTLIHNCRAAGFGGVELRSTHRHGVEITLSAEQRREVAKHFADSPIELVGLGSACEYHSSDPAQVRRNIEETKAFVRLCRDVGGSGVKVRPNGLPADVPTEKTLEQIGKSLGEVARYAADYNVKIRLEVHGRQSQELPHIKRMMDVADHPNAVVCWNCNPSDSNGGGLESNFKLVRDKIEIVHIHDLRKNNYPWKQLFGLLKRAGFSGWTLLEEGKVPQDVVAAMKQNRQVRDTLVTAE